MPDVLPHVLRSECFATVTRFAVSDLTAVQRRQAPITDQLEHLWSLPCTKSIRSFKPTSGESSGAPECLFGPNLCAARLSSPGSGFVVVVIQLHLYSTMIAMHFNVRQLCEALPALPNGQNYSPKPGSDDMPQ